MKVLDYENIRKTLIYTQLVTSEDDDYVCRVAANVNEATGLIEVAYEYVCRRKASGCFENATESIGLC